MLTSPIPYLGSKRLEIKYIVDNQPEFKNVIDVFGGGGSVSLYYFQNGYNVVYNDIDNSICQLFNAIQDEETIKKVVESVLEYEAGEDLKDVLEHYKTYNDLESMLILKHHAYRGMLTTPLINRRKINGVLVKEKHYNPNKLLKYPPIFKEKKLEITNNDYKIIFEENKNNEDVFLYLDPPYLSTFCGDYTNSTFIFDDITYIKDFLDSAICKVMLHIEFTGYVYDTFKDKIKFYYPKRYNMAGKKNIYQKYICIITNY